MCHHPAPEQRNASGEVIRHDIGGWISGPSADGAEPVPADDVHPGDLLLITGIEAHVTARRGGRYWIDGELTWGFALDWEAGSSRATLFRRLDDLVDRIGGTPAGG